MDILEKSILSFKKVINTMNKKKLNNLISIIDSLEQNTLTCKEHPYSNTYTSITGALCCLKCFKVIK